MTHMQELSDKNFQATIKIPQKVKANTIKYKKLKSLSKEIKYIKKKQRAILELKNIKLKRKKKKNLTKWTQEQNRDGREKFK